MKTETVSPENILTKKQSEQQYTKKSEISRSNFKFGKLTITTGMKGNMIFTSDFLILTACFLYFKWFLIAWKKNFLQPLKLNEIWGNK